MIQLLSHLIGDYILQSHDMATKKVNSSLWALYHAFMYTLPFLFITQNPIKLSLICFSHFLIDRFRLAKYITRYKNIIFGKCGESYGGLAVINDNEQYYTDTGYPKETPAWLSVWLLIITDNTLHLIINYLILNN